MASQVFIPLTVGGGVRQVSDIQRLLNAGADKISINSAAVANPELVRAASDYHGSQCVVVAIDARRVSQPGEPARWEVFTHGGRKATGLDAVTWARRMAAYGAGEILLTSMDRDGTKSGFDLELTRAVSDAVPVPVIASGGVGNLQHLADGVTTGRASAVLAASIFHFGQHTVRECKQFMAAQGIPTGCDPPRALRASLRGAAADRQSRLRAALAQRLLLGVSFEGRMQAGFGLALPSALDQAGARATRYCRKMMDPWRLRWLAGSAGCMRRARTMDE